MKKPHDIGSQINGEEKYKIILGKKNQTWKKIWKKKFIKL
jgi:hypothetical protein